MPVLPGSAGAVDLAGAEAFLAGLGPAGAMVIKAVSGGGGRGMRVVEDAGGVAEAYARCRSEAKAAFGNGAVYVEELIPRARHIEIQVVGDGCGGVSHLGERECSVQRRHQKIVEIAPSPQLSEALRSRIAAAAVRMAQAVGYRSLGTFEFLVDATADDRFVFIEANARLQVEHTVTEEVTGVDLVQSQLRIAGGECLADLGLTQESVPAPRGYAIQSRVNLEQMQPDGTVRPAGGMLTVFEAPSGPGVRVDTYGCAGYATNPNFDSLLGKVIAASPSPDFGAAVKRSLRALDEFQIDGVETNIGFLLQRSPSRRLRRRHGLHPLGRRQHRDARRHAMRSPTARPPATASPARAPSSTPATRSPRSTSSARARALAGRARPPPPRSSARPTPTPSARRCRAPWSRSRWPSATRSARANSCS